MIRKILTLTIMMFSGLALAFGQGPQYTSNSADQTLRSNGRVNPSSLGLEIDIPLIGYKGRGISLPLGLNYSSKQWRLEEFRTVQDQYGYTHTWVTPRYSEDAAAGWTSSLSQPYIEYTGEKYRFDDGTGRQGAPLSMDEIFTPPYTPPGNSYIKRITVHLPGESHELIAQDAPSTDGITGDGPPDESVWNTTFYATDGSGLKYVQTPSSNLYRLYMPDGSFYDFNATRESKNTVDFTMQVRRAYRLTEVNGNYVQFNAPGEGLPNGSWSDQLGRTFPVMIPRETPTLGTGESVKVQSFTLPGMSAPYVLKWKRLKGDDQSSSAFYNSASRDTSYPGSFEAYAYTATYSPALFGNTGPTYTCGRSPTNIRATTYGGKFNPVVLTDVILPNGASYRFNYNEFGEIERIYYPTGGHEEITYNEVPSLAELKDLYKDTNRGVTVRKVYESDSDNSVDTSSYSAASSPNNYRTSVVAPDGTQTDRYMHRGIPEPSCAGRIPDQYYGTRWGYDNVFAGMQYDERVFSSAGNIVSRKLTRWGATTTTALMMYPNRYAQRNARVLSTESITYEGNAGLSAVTALEYETGVDDLGSPQNVLRTTEYAFRVVSDGNSLLRAAAPDLPPADAVALPDPTGGSTAVRVIENVHLQSDPAYSSVKNEYLARNLVKLVTKTFVKNGAGTVTAAQSEIKYDEPSYNNPDLTNAYRGQPTTVRSWLDTNNSWIETRTKYDAYGNGIEATDARGNTTTTAYDSTYHAFPVQVTSPIPSDGTYGSNVAFVTSTAFNPTTGLPTSTTDANGQITTISYNDPVSGLLDPLLRVRKITAPNGQQTITEYGDGTSASTRFVKTKSQIDETNWKEGYTWYDGLGRTTKSQSVDSNGDVFVETEYDNMSRPFRVTNPYRNGETLYWTESTFDTAGRPWKTTTPDGAFIETTYGVAIIGGNIGTAVTVKDQSGKLRRSITNASGHLTRVDEPNAAGQLGAIDAPNQATFYTYDLLNNLTQVQQPGDNNEECGPSTTTCTQTRSFSYDSLSRLKQATNPESGTIQYGYDSNGNLQTKLDARNIKTIYDYDNLNRVFKRCYRVMSGSLGATSCAAASGESPEPNTPDVSYYYDLVVNAKGKLIKVTNGTGDNHSTTEYVSFDILGRVTRSRQTTDGIVYGDDTHQMTYTYNLSGALIEQQYPSGRVVKNILDGDGDLATVRSKKNQNNAFWNYANRFTYNAAGALTSMQLGNGRWESTKFNERLQPIQIALGKTAPVVNGQQVTYSTELLKLEYQYGDLNWDGTVLSGTNNGNVAKQTITVAGVGATPGFTAVQNYDYDPLNRIQIASETLTPTSGTPETWTQEFRYDRYGNRTFHEPTTTTLPKNCGTAPNFTVCTADGPKVNPSVSPANNRLNGYSFDTAGNTINDAENKKFTYDAENKQVKVETVSGSTVTGTVGEYIYDGDGRRVKKLGYENNEIIEETIFVYDAGGRLIGEYSNLVASSQDAKIAYLTSDHLGSPRLNTDLNGNVRARHDYHPFGEEIAGSKRVEAVGYADDPVRKQFTGYERDPESALDFAEARYYNRSHGRFTTVDPLYMTDERLIDPQQLNTYGYVRNNPLKYTDPTGFEIKLKGPEKDWAKGKIVEGTSFGDVVGVNDQGKLAVGNGSGGFLDPSRKEDKALLDAMAQALKDDKDVDLFKAIIDPSNQAVLEANTSDNTSDIGSSISPGTNSVDRKDAEMVEKAGKGQKGALTAAEIVKHEAMEAYGTAKTGKALSADPGPHRDNPYSGVFTVVTKETAKKMTLVGLTSRPGSGVYTMTKTFDGGTSNNVRTGNITKVTYKPNK